MDKIGTIMKSLKTDTIFLIIDYHDGFYCLNTMSEDYMQILGEEWVNSHFKSSWKK